MTDPPYGLKARSKKTAKSEQESDEPRILNFCPFGVEETGIFSKKEDYEYQKVYYDLLDNAHKYLKMGGHCVFLFHVD